MYIPDWNKEYYWLHLVTKDTTNKTPIITYAEDLINMNNCDHLYLIYDLETNLLITLEIYLSGIHSSTRFFIIYKYDTYVLLNLLHIGYI